MATLLENFRDAFKKADTQSNYRGSVKLLDKDSEGTILADLSFASKDDKPKGPLLYHPFSWNRNGITSRGLLVRDDSDDKIYGLEREDGVSMNASGAKKLLEELVLDEQSSFSDPRKMPGSASVNNPIHNFRDAFNYMLLGRKHGEERPEITNMISNNDISKASLFLTNLRNQMNRGGE